MSAFESFFDNGRFIGTESAGDGSYTRVVDKLVIHGGHLEPAQLLDRLVTEDTRYLVFDLDRTFHLGRNMGELLGWELCLSDCYGDDYLERIEPERGTRTMLSPWRRPLAFARFMWRALRFWAYPGLLYLLLVKISMRYSALQKWVYSRMGVEPVARVQEVPRLTLMCQLAGIPLERLRRLSSRVWLRFESDQVFGAEDFVALRQRFPHLKIIVSSASPQPVLEAAASHLGVDDILYTSIEERDGVLTAPAWRHRFLPKSFVPERYALPQALHQNAAHSKIDKLVERYPDFLDVETVGVTDTSYGEDHSWAQYFTRVADVNSPTPFAPIVSATSPLREIHSAQVLTRSERERRTAGEDGYVDPRRRTVSENTRIFVQAELQKQVWAVQQRTEELAQRYHRTRESIQEQRRRFETEFDGIQRRLEDAIGRYNTSMGEARAQALVQIRAELRKLGSVNRALAKAQKPLALLTWSIRQNLSQSRERLELPDSVAPPKAAAKGNG